MNLITKTFAILTVVSAGCKNESPQSPNVRTHALTQNKRDNMTVASDPSRPLVTIEIRGNKTKTETLSDEDESE